MLRPARSCYSPHRCHLCGETPVGAVCAAAAAAINKILNQMWRQKTDLSLSKNPFERPPPLARSTDLCVVKKRADFNLQALPTGVAGGRVEGPPCPVLDRELPQPVGRLEVLAQTGRV